MAAGDGRRPSVPSARIDSSACLAASDFEDRVSGRSVPAADLGFEVRSLIASAREPDLKFVVEIGPHRFDPKDEAAKARRRATSDRKRLAAALNLPAPVTPSKEPGLWILQFAHDPDLGMIGHFRDHYGLTLIGGLSSLTFIELMTQATADRVRREAGVRACIRYWSELKLARSSLAASEEMPGERLLSLGLISTPSEELLATLASLGFRPSGDPVRYPGGLLLRVTGEEGADPENLLLVGEVEWVEDLRGMVVTSDSSSAVVQGGAVDGSHPIWDHLLHGENQIIGIYDVGPLDMSHDFFRDLDHPLPGPNHRKVLAAYVGLFVKLHTGDPGPTGTLNAAAETGVVQMTRFVGSGSFSTNGIALLWPKVLTAETFSHVSFWSARSGGLFRGSDKLPVARAVQAGDDFTIAIADLRLVFPWTQLTRFFVKLHKGDPGAWGTSNPAGETRRFEATFAVAGDIRNSGEIKWPNFTTGETISHCSIWSASSGGTFISSADLAGGPIAAQVGATFTIPAGRLKLLSHGTAVSGSAAGDDVNARGSHPFRGGAWAAKLIYCDIGEVDEIGVLRGVLADGARIINESAGETLADGTKPAPYTSLSAKYDDELWKNEELLFTSAVGNSSGEFLGAPGTAKNPLTVAGTKDIPNHNTLATGKPGTADGRRKPDLVAVGERVISSDFGAAVGDSAVLTSHNGTSLAAPHVAAAAALVRQYFTDGWYPSGKQSTAQRVQEPSGMLLKAVLLNATVVPTGEADYPSQRQGWGRLELNQTLHFDGDKVRLWVKDVPHVYGFGETGVRIGSLTVPKNVKSMKITLVFNDPAGAVSSSDPVVNQLDLLVSEPQSDFGYFANDFDQNKVTRRRKRWDTDFPPDPLELRNNVRQVVVEAPIAGRWRLGVFCYRFDKAATPWESREGRQAQGFALVARMNLD